MRILKVALILLAFFSLAVVGSTFAAKTKKPKPTCGATSSQREGDCPDQGCGGDALLNRRKNLVTKASSPETFTRTDFVKLKFPESWHSGTSRTLLKKWGEGTAVTYDAFLLKVKNYPSGAEACNCNLKLNENNDFHLVTGHKRTTPEDDSITGEISPRFRPEGWTLTKLKQLAKDKAYVRLTGYLMLDTQHVGKSVPARVTHWEIHPVTSFKVCTGTVVSCKAGNNWQDLADFPEP